MNDHPDIFTVIFGGIAVIAVIGAIVAGFIYGIWFFAATFYQVDRTQEWLCNANGGEMEWRQYESGNYYRACAPKP